MKTMKGVGVLGGLILGGLLLFSSLSGAGVSTKNFCEQSFAEDMCQVVARGVRAILQGGVSDVDKLVKKMSEELKQVLKLPKGTSCAVCQEIIALLQAELQENATIADIESVLRL